MSEILVRSTRNWVVENIIRGSVTVLSQDGRIKACCGDSYVIAYLRSAAKPLMAVTLVESGAAAAFGLSDEEIAVAAGSHIGAPAHVAAVASLLQKIGLGEDDLILCPAYSLDRRLREQCLRDHIAPRKLYHCCSGKHAAMLALCRHHGWDISGYPQRTHPVQQLLLQTVADFAVLPAADIIIGVDGCGVPVHGMPLYNMALAYYNLCNSEQLRGARQQAAQRVLDAITKHPTLLAGENHFCSELIRVTNGRIIGKPGADGIYCLAEREGAWSLAVKIEDGNDAALPAVIIRAFRQMHILSEEEHQALRHFAVRDITTCSGEKVGEMKAAFHLEML